MSGHPGEEPYGIPQMVIHKELSEISRTIDEKKKELDELYLQYGLLEKILGKIDEERGKYKK